MKLTKKCRECGGLTFRDDGLCTVCKIELEMVEIEKDLELFQADRGEEENENYQGR